MKLAPGVSFCKKNYKKECIPVGTSAAVAVCSGSSACQGGFCPGGSACRGGVLPARACTHPPSLGTELLTHVCENITFQKRHLQTVTRQHSSRMTTVCLPTIEVYMLQWPPLDVSTGWLGTQVNKFVNVSSDDHQMSVAEEGVGPRSYVCDLSHDAFHAPKPSK